jgi:hypothetical protein
MAGGSSRVERVLLGVRCTFLAGTFRHVQGILAEERGQGIGRGFGVVLRRRVEASPAWHVQCILFHICLEIALHGNASYGATFQGF